MNHRRCLKIPEIIKRICAAAGEKFRRAAAVLRRKNAQDDLAEILSGFDADALKRELKYHHASFDHLLEPCCRFLDGNPDAYFSSAQQLHNGWEYSLDGGETPMLQRLYAQIGQETPDESGLLRLWMEYLKRQGFSRMHAGMDAVTISPEMRKCYHNTLGLADGDVLNIESHPWEFEEEVVSGGMLKR